MSIPFTNLECEKCGFQSGDGVIYGDFRYVDGDSEIPVKRILGWCYDCQKFAAIEDFGDKEEVSAEIEKIQDELRAGISKRLPIPFFRSRQQQLPDRLEQLPELIRRLVLIERRKGHEKCLACGSKNVSPFDGNYSQIDPFGSDQENIRTGHIHPGCGGEFLGAISSMRFFVKYEAKFYSIDGDRV